MKKDKKIISPRPPREGEGNPVQPKGERVYPSDHTPDHEINAFENERKNHDKEENDDKSDL